MDYAMAGGPTLIYYINAYTTLISAVYSGSVVKTNFYAIYNESGECMFFS